MLHSRQNNNKIKHKHKRCLRRIQNCHLMKNSCKKMDQSFSVHHRNIQSLAIEMLQIKHGQSREFVTDTFIQTIEEYYLRQNRGFRTPSVNTQCIMVPKNYTTKVLLQASQAIYKWCLFSSIMYSYIFYIQSICFIILLSDFYVFVLIF